MPLKIIQNDISKMNTDAIVNAANIELRMGSGVCGAIFQAAGAAELQQACNPLAPIKTGEAVITPAFKLEAKYVIHTAGPVYRDGTQGERELLRACFDNSLKLAHENGCKSIALPLISTGIYRFPKAEALEIATVAITAFLEQCEMEIVLVVFDKAAFGLSNQLMGEIESFIDENYVEKQTFKERFRQLLQVEEQALFEETLCAPAVLAEAEPEAALEDLIENLDESFSDALLRMIDRKGKTDVEVYKRANIDRKLFSKIRTGKCYMPSKRTAVALAIALELNLSETNQLLNRAGFTLSHSQKFDVIIEFFISRNRFNIFEINEVLFYYDQQLLGG